MKKKSISGGNIRLNQDIHFKGTKTEVRTKGEVCVPAEKNENLEPANPGLFASLALGAIPISSGSITPSSMVLSALGAIGQAASISVTQDPVTAKYIINYILSTLKVVNGAYAQNGNLSEDELKKLIMALMAKILEKAGPGFSNYNQVLKDLMQNATLGGFLKGVQSTICALINDPVNANTGNFIYDKEDLSVKGRIPLSFKRFYNCVDKRQGCMGTGWRHNYEIQLLIEEDRYVIIWEDGREEVYMRDGEGGITPLFGCLCRFTIHEKSYFYHAQNGILFIFDSAGLLISAKDDNEKGLTFLYNKHNKLISVSNGQNSTLRYQYDRITGKLLSVCDHTGRTVTLSYELGRLRKVTNAVGEMYQYDYDDNCILYRVRNPRNICVLENKYDNKGRTKLQTLADGGEIHYDYQEEDSRTLVTQQNSGKVAYYHDDRFRNVKTVYMDGEEQYSYNDRNQVIQHIDKNGNKTKYAYDDKGNRTQTIYPDGSKHNMTYDVNSRLLVLSINGIAKQKNSYDANGNLLKSEDAIGRYRKFEYGDNGFLTRIEQADGSSSHIEYDAQGNIAGIIDELNNKVSYFYDDCNRVVKTVDGKGNPTNYKYDACDRIISVINADKKHRSYGYAKNGKLSKIVDFNEAVTLQSYNAMNQIEQIVFPDGGKISMEYDLMQNISKRTDANGAETLFQYDMLNHLEQVALPNGGTIRYEYDLNGNRTAVIDANGNATKLEYDERNRVIAVTDPGNARVEYEYDLVGNLIRIKNACGKYQNFTYDEADQLICNNDITGNTTCYEYNELGKLSSLIDPMKRKTIYEYYPGGTLEKISYPNGHFEKFSYDENKNLIHRENHKGEFLEFMYDCLDRIVQIQSSFGQEKIYTYDALGNITSMKDAIGNVSKYTYSAGGKLTSVLDASGNRTEYAYDEAGKLITICQHKGDEFLLNEGIKDPNAIFKQMENEAHITQYVRDPLGEIIKITDPIGLQEEYSYSLAGQMILKKDKEGYETRYDYTPAGEISKISYADGRSVAFSYNSLRQLIQVQDWLGSTQIEIDDSGRRKKVIDYKGREVAYDWGRMGEQKAIVYPNGKKVEYEYDGQSRLKRLVDGEREIQYDYNEDGMLSEVNYPDGVVTSREYNQMGLLKSFSHKKNGALLDQYLIEYDKAGNKTGIQKKRTAIDMPMATTSHIMVKDECGYYQYKYDGLNQLTEVKKDRKLLAHYTYDAFGNRIQQETEESHLRYYYNGTNQLIRKDTDGMEETYQYDARGNLTAIHQGKSVLNQYLYDETNRLSKTFNSKGRAAQFQYDGMGNRIGMKEYTDIFHESYRLDELLLENPVKEVDYLLDLTKQYSNLLEKTENTKDGTILQNYTWDDTVVFMTEGESAYIYLNDELGSAIRLLEIEGNQQTVYGYNEFGLDLYKNQGLEQPFGFTGYRFDNITNTYFAQAREYFPDLGRFGGRDQVKGMDYYPFTLNEYNYCWLNPLKWVDGNGRTPSQKEVNDFLWNRYWENAADAANDAKDALREHVDPTPRTYNLGVGDQSDSDYMGAMYMVNWDGAVKNGHSSLLLIKENGQANFFSYAGSVDAGAVVPGVGSYGFLSTYTEKGKSSEILSNDFFKNMGTFADDVSRPGRNSGKLDKYSHGVYIPITDEEGDAMFSKAVAIRNNPGLYNLYDHNCNQVAQIILSAGGKNFSPNSFDWLDTRPRNVYNNIVNEIVNGERPGWLFGELNQFTFSGNSITHCESSS